MRIYVDYSDLINNDSFLLWYLMVSFPIGLNEEEDDISEIMSEKYYDKIDQNFINELTGYYDGIFDKTDGYVDNPKAVKIDFNNNELTVEFHAGDTIYFLNDKEIGFTGCEYFIQKIPFVDFKKYIKGKESLEILFILPMVQIVEGEIEQFRKIVIDVIGNIKTLDNDFENICYCVISNCLKNNS